MVVLRRMIDGRRSLASNLSQSRNVLHRQAAFRSRDRCIVRNLWISRSKRMRFVAAAPRHNPRGDSPRDAAEMSLLISFSVNPLSLALRINANRSSAVLSYCRLPETRPAGQRIPMRS